jgi:uncharacterized protein (DUF488 family)
MRLFTIGFTKKSAREFFGLLRDAEVRRVIDTRLNNRSQLAGFSKAGDLEYFLRAIAGIDYTYCPSLAPTEPILDRYKKQRGSWAEYEVEYLRLLEERNIAREIVISEFEDACLLCSEDEPTHCHRRLAAEYLKRHFPNIEIIHLR